MNVKEILAKLIKVAENQQKAITKLAQQTGSAELSAQHLDPNKTEKQSARLLYNSLPDKTKSAIVNIEEHGNDMLVGFKPGLNTQENFNAVLSTLQSLTNKGIIQHPYTLKAV